MDLAFHHKSSINNFPLFRMASERVIIKTPISLQLPLTSSTETETVVLLVDLPKLRNHFLVQDDDAVVHCVTCSNHNSIWMNPCQSNNNSTPKDMTQEPPVQGTTTTIPNNDSPSEDDTISGVSVLDAEPIETELSLNLQNQLRIGEPSEKDTSRQTSESGKVSKSRVYRHRKWKWTAPTNQVSGGKFTINSRNEFKMIFFCIFMKDTNRVLSLPELRKVLHQLGYDGGMDEYGPLNSARSYMKHFKRWGLHKPRGSRTFLGMVNDFQKVEKFMHIAEILLSNLD